MIPVKAPLPGVFFRRPSPSEPDFKKPGDPVAVGETIGVIEMMKSFTPVEAIQGGRFVAYLVESEGAVDVDDDLCHIEPTP
jgi:biotin carboxyl carrier protein